MRKNRFLLILLGILLLSMATVPASAAPAAPVDWAWLVAQAASGAESITLPNSIVCDSNEGLVAAGNTLRIEGKGFALTGALVDGGTVIFKDVRLLGTHGFGNEDGGDALTLRGEGTIAVLSGASRAEGGISAPDGERGGDGIQLTAASQGLILKDTTTATGGVGRLYGGTGVNVSGMGCNVLATGSAAMIGGVGLVEGGMGLAVPACCTVSMSEQASATGGASAYQGGTGLQSVLCAEGMDAAGISLVDTAMAIGGVGQDGGHGILLDRTSPREGAPDFRIEDMSMVFGGDGNTAGAALHATNAAIAYEGTPSFFGGMYYDVPTKALMLDSCRTDVADATLNIVEGSQTQNYPARNVSSILSIALSQQSDRYVPTVIEDGLTTKELATKLNGFTVERGTTSQAKVNDGGLKIYMYSGTLEKRLNFQQRLMDDGEGGTRLVLIGAVSDEWPTIESSTGAIAKLHSLGITQLAYTCAAPVYNERVLDIATLLEAIEADGEVAKVMCGTADDAVIFIREDGTRDYQEMLMADVIRPAI